MLGRTGQSSLGPRTEGPSWWTLNRPGNHDLGSTKPRAAQTVPCVGPLLAYTIASEIGDIRRFASPKKLAGYTGLCPIVRQSGNRDFRGPLAKNGPKYLRWALVEAATHAARHP